MAYLTGVRAALRNAVLAGFLVGLAAAPSVRAATAVVKITHQEMFSPKTLTIRAGDTVEWINSSGAVHTVTDDPALAATPKDATLPKGAAPFNSGFLKAGQAYRHRFTAPGQYRYFCLLHESSGMVGAVLVK